MELKGYIHQSILSLLGCKDHKELLQDRPPNNISALSASMFYVKWTESKKSALNKVAASIVATKVMNNWPALCMEDNQDKIHGMATQHIHYLIKFYKCQCLPANNAKQLAW
ncbi:hypothetical protein FS749_006801 [Ceratobasidium sp. UAMH 11750]|nr:hypothetical protein FS749_006801 [Ceratobasidium sp. UAMH 11750]